MAAAGWATLSRPPRVSLSLISPSHPPSILSPHFPQELLGQGDLAEALLRFSELRCAPMSLRQHIVAGALEAGLELAPSPKADLGKLMKIGRVLCLLVPARIVTREHLQAGVVAVMSNLAGLRLDFPAAEGCLANMCCAGLVAGTLKEAAFHSSGAGVPGHDAVAQRARGYIAAGYVAVEVARLLGKEVDGKGAGLLLPRGEEGGGGEGGAGAEGGGSAAAAAAAAQPAPSAGGSSAAQGGAGEEEEAGATTLLKKKKKKVVVEEDD